MWPVIGAKHDYYFNQNIKDGEAGGKGTILCWICDVRYK